MSPELTCVKSDYWCHHTMRKHKSLEEAMYRHSIWQSYWAQFWSHHSPDTNMTVNRPPDDFRIQSSKPPLTIESFATEAPDIMKKRHPFCVPAEFLNHWMNKHDKMVCFILLWLDWLISRSRYLEHANPKVIAELDIEQFWKKKSGKHLKRIRTQGISSK